MAQQQMRDRRDAGKSQQALDSNQVGMLKVWVAIMPDYMKKLDEIHNVMLGRIDTPTPQAGMIEQIRDMQHDITSMKASLEAIQRAYVADKAQGTIAYTEGMKRIADLEKDSIIYWIRRNKKMALLLAALFVIAIVPEVRIPVLHWVQDNWFRIALP